MKNNEFDLEEGTTIIGNSINVAENGGVLIMKNNEFDLEKYITIVEEAIRVADNYQDRFNWTPDEFYKFLVEVKYLYETKELRSINIIADMVKYFNYIKNASDAFSMPMYMTMNGMGYIVNNSITLFELLLNEKDYNKLLFNIKI